MRLGARISISRRPEDVFAFLANRTNLPQWAAGVGSVSRTNEGAPGVGAKFKVEGRALGRAFPSVYEVTEYGPPSRLSGCNTGLLSFAETFELHGAAGSTVVIHAVEVGLSRSLIIVEPLLRLTLSSQLKKDLASLKRVLEAMPEPGRSAQPASE
jgi:hypothetical protein